MKAALSAPWAKSPSNLRREATSGEVISGFPCGAADQQLFNEREYRTSLMEIELANLLAATGLTPNENDFTQVNQAVQIIAGRRATEVYTAGQVLSSTTFVAGNEYVVQTLNVTNAASIVAYCSFMALMTTALQADVSPRIRVIRVSDSAVIDTSPQAGTIMGTPYVGDARQIVALSAVTGLSPQQTYTVQFIAVANGYAGDLDYYNPFITVIY